MAEEEPSIEISPLIIHIPTDFKLFNANMKFLAYIYWESVRKTCQGKYSEETIEKIQEIFTKILQEYNTITTPT